MKEIDWSKAPEGATHHNHARCSPWLRDGERPAYFHDGEWVEYTSPDAGRALINEVYSVPRPAAARAVPAWTGTGLPPVGTVCEACWTSPDEYYQIKVLAHDDGKAVYRWQTGPGSGELSESEGGIHGEFSKPHPKFRPIRTPEQIAAEEREKAIAEIERVATAGEDSGKRWSEALYDAGYRRQEPQE